MRSGLIALSAVAAILVGACAPGAPVTQSGAPSAQATSEGDISLSGPVTVTIWHNQTGILAKGFQDLVDEFNKTNGKGITVKAEDQSGGRSYTGLYQKMLGAIQAGATPDMIVAVENQVADYAKAGVIVDLAPYMSSPKNGLTRDALADIYAPYLASNKYPQYGDQTLSFPFIKSLEVLYRNDDLAKELGFTAPPKTWAELESQAKAAVKKDASGKVTRWGMSTLSLDSFLGSVLNKGGAIVKPDLSAVGFDGKEGLSTLQMEERGIGEGWMYIPKGYDWQDRFAEGNLLYVGGTSTSVGFILDSLKGKALDWSVVPWPDGGAKVRGEQFGGVVAVTKSTPEKQLAAWDFLKWFSDTKQTSRWAALSGYMPVRASAANEQVLKDYWAKRPQSKQAFDLIPLSQAGPSIRGYQEIRDAAQEALTKVVTKKATAADALSAAGVKANAILKENQ
ncbi:MAG: extracellular solute-binding protein [Chloroflexota bacterium]|nr:extracellular solute-binding protein [Chloroflexota bacterium]MDE3194100.1 extracellular solute-binding protein [Chloroflexota bacterium]